MKRVEKTDDLKTDDRETTRPTSHPTSHPAQHLKSPGRPKAAPLVVEGISRREKLVAICIGGALFVFLLFGFSKMGGRVSGNTLTGTVIKKVYTPNREQQVTVGGRRGLDARKKEGDYELHVVVNGTEYVVPVYKEVYDAKQEGEPFTFPRPPQAP